MILALAFAFMEPVYVPSRFIDDLSIQWKQHSEITHPIFYVTLVLISLVIFLRLRRLPSDLRARRTSVLDPMQLEELMLGSPPQIIDLRTPAEFQGKKGHIRGAINIPMVQLPRRIHELDTSHPRPIVLVDETDVLSHQSLPIFAQQGHRWVYVLKGGYRAWRWEKLPIYHYQETKKKS